MSTSRYAVMAAAIFAFSISAASADTAKPLRHLEYHFDVGVRGETTVRDSGIGSGDHSAPGTTGNAPASGVGTQRTGIADTGTITADFMGMSGDGGAIYIVNERGRDSRIGEPAQCVVYGNTYLICDQSKTVFDEEIALLRSLGKDFTHAVPIDAKNHWQYRETTPTSTETTDYTIKNDAGGIVTLAIDDLMTTSGMNAYNAVGSGTIRYSRTASVPTSITMQTISHTKQGSSRGETNLELTLQSDSLASSH